MLKKILCVFVALSLIASAMARALAVSEPLNTRLETEFVNHAWLDESYGDSSTPALTPTLNIRNIQAGGYVYSKVLIIVQVKNIVFLTTKVYYTIDVQPQKYVMTRVPSTDRFQATWDTTYLAAGRHTLLVRASDMLGHVLASASVSVIVAKAYRYQLYYEIDYMSGHYPPASVLNYVRDYWKGHAVKVSFWIDDVVADPTPSDRKITNADFWKIEKTYNNVWKYDDRSFGGASRKYTLKEKWMLYGTWADSSTIGGYTFVTISGSDVLAGNYMFIADSMIDNWEATNNIPFEGGEIVVVSHEMGHSIGIAKLSTSGYEVYDSDYYSVMSLMRLQNAKYMARYWYYSKEYWATVNLLISYRIP